LSVQIESLTKITTARAADICALAAAGGFKLSASEGASPAQYLNELIAAKRLEQAIQFFAFALPPREAVWWTCLCSRAVFPDPTPKPLLDAVEAAEAWVRKPTEELRRAAMASAQATDFRSPAAWAAMAAFWSGGSLAPADLPAVPAPTHLIGAAVAGAVALAAVQTEPLRADQKREHFLASAIDVANGGNGRVKPAAAGPTG
jgi:hypothetical protein